MVIDDLIERDHDCDLFFDQAYGRAESECTSRAPTTSQLLLGTHYAMLRLQFSQLRTPTLMVILAENKADVAKQLEIKGTVIEIENDANYQ
ncbi:hypothetical protein N9S07_02385 [Nitrosomonadales bacterium]|nr:hypothetical protein [Nitrosomonadales bacterium]